jgi:alkylation response protein AidB-like acyl-CoA dehydrogenase
MSQALLKAAHDRARDPLQSRPNWRSGWRPPPTPATRPAATQRRNANGYANPACSHSIPTAYGGQGADWPTVYQVIRILARADSALAHVFGFHHLQLAGIQLYGSAQQQRRLLTQTVEQNLFWGNALNPLDKRTTATDADYGFQLDGVKSFSSGSVGSDWLTISAWHETQRLDRRGADAPARRGGAGGLGCLRPEADRQRQCAFQSGVAAVDAGAASAGREADRAGDAAFAGGAADYGQSLSRHRRRRVRGGAAVHGARGAALVRVRRGSAGADPLVQHRFGQLWLKLRPAAVLADQAAQELERLFRLGAAVTAQQRGELAISVAEAKVLAHQAGVDVSSEIFELTGARSTSAKFGFDRYWRNVRVHTLHDPVDYKIRDLGRYALDGTLPEPTAYS